MTAAADEFEALEPAAQELNLGGGTFRVAPLTINRLPAFARALRPILPTISELGALDEKAERTYAADLLLGLLADHGELLVEAAAVATAANPSAVAEQRTRVGELNPADFVLLALACIRANLDFFLRQLLPLLLKARQDAKAAAGAGSTPSSP